MPAQDLGEPTMTTLQQVRASLARDQVGDPRWDYRACCAWRVAPRLARGVGGPPPGRAAHLEQRQGSKDEPLSITGFWHPARQAAASLLCLAQRPPTATALPLATFVRRTGGVSVSSLDESLQPISQPHTRTASSASSRGSASSLSSCLSLTIESAAIRPRASSRSRRYQAAMPATSVPERAWRPLQGRLGRRKRPKTWKDLAQTVESV
jgi:hypothetical protein